MFKRSVYAIILAALGTAGCGSESRSPAAPTSATVSAAEAAADGSTLKATAPPLLLPEGGATIDSTVPNLVITPAAGKFTGVDGLVYRIAVETQSGSEVYRSETIVDGGTGLIAQRLPEGQLAWGTNYRWRARAEQGALIGPWSAYATFQTPPEPAPAAVQSPENGSTARSAAPDLVVTNAGLPAGASTNGFEHRFVIETTAGVVLLNTTVGSGTATTTYSVPADTLQPLTTYRWRVRGERGSAFYGPWSPYWTFTTSSPITWPTTPEEVVAFVAGKYPEYLVATGSLHEREENMRFLRDRMIEAGICGGLDLAWNLKRGVGPHSTDALLHRDPTGGRVRDRVIDIAAGFDDYGGALRLHWIEVSGPPGYDQFLPRPSCK